MHLPQIILSISTLSSRTLHCHLHPLQVENCKLWMKMIWRGLKIKEICDVLVNQFHGNFRSKAVGCRKIKSVFRDVKWCFNASWGPKGLTAKLSNLNFHPLEVVSRWRDPQLQVSEYYSDLTKWRSTLFKSCWLMSHFIFIMFKRWYSMC